MKADKGIKNLISFYLTSKEPKNEITNCNKCFGVPEGDP